MGTTHTDATDAATARTIQAQINRMVDRYLKSKPGDYTLVPKLIKLYREKARNEKVS